MLIEKNNRIKCGGCKTEYTPRMIAGKKDYSCPQCGAGRAIQNEGQTSEKQILKD